MRTAYTIARTATSAVVIGPGGSDTVTNVERLAFADMTVPLGFRVAANDLNDDGVSDILFRRPSDGWMTTWDIANGQVISGHHLGPLDPATWPVEGKGDFNGDGASDILFRRPGDGFMTTWEIANGQVVGGHHLGALDPDTWKFKGTGDFNGDGTSDLLFRRPGDGSDHRHRPGY